MKQIIIYRRQNGLSFRHDVGQLWHVSSIVFQYSIPHDNLLAYPYGAFATICTSKSLKGAYMANVSHFCMHNCALRKISPRHAVNWDQQCRLRRMLFLSPAALPIHSGSSSIGSISCVFLANLFV